MLQHAFTTRLDLVQLLFIIHLVLERICATGIFFLDL